MKKIITRLTIIFFHWSRWREFIHSWREFSTRALSTQLGQVFNSCPKPLILLLTIVLCQFNTVAQEEEKPSPVEFGATYIGDAFYNFDGGLKTGEGYMGYIDLAASFSTEGLGLWKNGELFVNVQNTHVNSLSGNFVGDAQVVSNIDNGDYTYLYQFWYKQTIGKISILAGIHDLNSEFFASDYGGEYVNSSFGIMPLASLNVPVAIFPKTTLAAMIKYEISDDWAFQTSVYDGDPLDLDSIPYNGEIVVGDDHGLFSATELHYMLNSDVGKNGVYKLGFYYHTREFEDITDPTISHQGNYGIYLLADQMLLPSSDEGDKGLGVFLHAGYSPDDRSMNDVFVAGGLNLYGVGQSRSNDVIGLGVTHASLSNQLYDSAPAAFEKHETTIECFYKLKLGDNITFQPELQYVINPGFDATIDNATVGLLRAYFEF